MSKIVMCADVHLGVGSRLHDIIYALNALCTYMVIHKIDTCIILGDLFHDREHISIDVICEAHKFFKEAKACGQTWIVFPGNHDMFLKRSWDYTSIQPLAEVLMIIDNVKILQLDNRRFWVLPFIYSENAYMRVLKRIHELYEPGDVLLTHIGVRTAIKNVCFLLQDWSFVDFTKSKFDQVFAGHFHINQKVGDNVEYIGSIIPFKADEGDSDHGFIVYDLDTRTREFISIWEAAFETGMSGTPPPPYITLSDELLAEKDSGDVHNSVVRVALSKNYSQSEKDAIRERLLGFGARRVSFFDVIAEEPAKKESHVSKPIAAPLLFLRWLEADKANLSEYNTALLKKLNSDITDEGDEIYQKQRLEE